MIHKQSFQSSFLKAIAVRYVIHVHQLVLTKCKFADTCASTKRTESLKVLQELLDHDVVTGVCVAIR
nr:hypothetical protein [Burkholderia pseudomallei]